MPSSIFKEMWQTISNGNIWKGELKNKKRDGDIYWAQIMVSPNYDNNELVSYTAIRQDITDKKRLEEISITDPLTNVYNRLYLDKSYAYEVQRAKRYNNSFSIILVDIDHFKEINDTYGHNVGDNVLKEIAAILKENIRQTDKLGRWGGEEFLIICPQTNYENARIIAENLRTIFCNHKFSSIENLTCSFDVSMYDINAKHDETFIKADKALYIAKNEGRNKVVVY